MKKLSEKPPDRKCFACKGTGFPVVTQPKQPNRKIYPAPCKKCSGKGRVEASA
jgi:DnaJ-class molecular chaperone